MSVSGNEIPYNVDIDTQSIEVLLQSIDAKMELIDEKLAILSESEEEQEEIETVSDNSIATYEAVQRIEMRMDTQVKMQFAGIIALIFSISILGAFLVFKLLPKR